MKNPVVTHDQISVLFGADDTYARPLAAAMQSVIMTAREPQRLHFYVLARMSVENHNSIRRSCDGISLTFIEIPDQLMIGLPRGADGDTAYISPATWLRIFAADLLPDEVDRVIYLDCDTITRSDIADLWDLDLEGKGLGAVRSIGREIGSPGRNLRHAGLGGRYGAIESMGHESYFNAGVLVCDLAFWRQHEICSQIIALVKEFGHVFLFGDQDALNLVFINAWTDAGLHWNNPTFSRVARNEITGDSSEQLKLAKVIHYTSAWKPWQARYPAGIGRDVYLEAESNTDWAGLPLEVIESPVSLQAS